MMNRFLLLVILCVGLAVLRAVAIILIASVVLGLIVSFITRPKQTLVFLGTLALSVLTVAQPISCVIALTVIVVAIAAVRHVQNPPHRRRIS